MSAEVIKGMFGATASGPVGKLPETIRRGSVGPLVKDLQQRLEQVNLLPPGTANGQFGPQTEAAVKKFQSMVGIAPLGIVSDATWTALLKQTGATAEQLTPTNPFLGPEGQVNLPSPQGIVQFFTSAPLWQKALMAGGALALGYLLVSWLTAGSALRGYERALNAEPKCPRNVPPREVPEDAKIVEAA